MSKIGVQGNFYLGVVSKILGETREEKQEYRIEADIPGVIKGIRAFPIRDTLDEPKLGDPVILLGLDPEYNSYYLYWKLKEDDVTGFRSAGKEVVMTPDEIVARVYSNDSGDYEDSTKEPAEEIASIRIKESGQIIMTNQAETEIIIQDNGDVNVNTSGHNMTVNLGGGTITLTNGSLLLSGGKVGGLPGAFVKDPSYLEKGMVIGRTNIVKLG